MSAETARIFDSSNISCAIWDYLDDSVGPRSNECLERLGKSIDEIRECFMQRMDAQREAENPSIPDCPICLNNVAIPVILECGHVFDADCLSQWYLKKRVCPLDRNPIDVSKIRFAPETIKHISVTCRVRLDDEPKTVSVNPNGHLILKRFTAFLRPWFEGQHSKELIPAAFLPSSEPKRCNISQLIFLTPGNCTKMYFSFQEFKERNIIVVASLKTKR